MSVYAVDLFTAFHAIMCIMSLCALTRIPAFGG